VIDDDDAPRLSRRVRRLARRSPWLRALVAREVQFPDESRPGFVQNEAEADFMLARALVALGLDPYEIPGALRASRAAAGVEHDLEPGYFVGTALRAIESLDWTRGEHGRRRSADRPIDRRRIERRPRRIAAPVREVERCAS
jgi:hypothetical protein